MAFTAPYEPKDLIYQKIDRELGSFLSVFLRCQVAPSHGGYQFRVDLFLFFQKKKPHPSIARPVFNKEKSRIGIRLQITVC